jgi:EAL domain-containing protein (putative c-di-GMP-specific phosphodiesterase class I)
MHSRLVNRLQLETDLRAAIAGRRLRVFYQPIIELASGRLKGFEALVRWPVDDPAIEPAEFVAVAEETGLIGRLGSLVLEDACGRLAEWRERGLVDPDVTVSVNVSRRQLGDAQLIADIEAALGRAGLPPQALCLEITETAIMDEPERMQAALAAIARIGVRAQVDDFGMGYSSLAFLRRFPGDTVKIDRSYIASMDQEEGSEAIVRAIIELARNLGVHTIAEGIEHAAQRDMLLALGCDYAQGFLFSKPVPGDAVESLIRSSAASPVR